MLALPKSSLSFWLEQSYSVLVLRSSSEPKISIFIVLTTSLFLSTVRVNKPKDKDYYFGLGLLVWFVVLVVVEVFWSGFFFFCLFFGVCLFIFGVMEVVGFFFT